MASAPAHAILMMRRFRVSTDTHYLNAVSPLKPQSQAQRRTAVNQLEKRQTTTALWEAVMTEAVFCPPDVDCPCCALLVAEVKRLRANNEALVAALRDIIADSFSVYAIQVARAALASIETPKPSAAENSDA
jgi:hypothetical protein